MTLAFPTHVADTMGAATAIGVEAAGHLLHDVGHAVSTAAVNTSGRARTMARAVRRSRQPRSFTSRNRIVFGALAAVALSAAMVRRLMSDRRGSEVLRTDDDNPVPVPVTTPQGNGTVASHQPDDINGRIKQAVGVDAV